MNLHPTQLFSLLFNKGDSVRLSQAVAKAEAQMVAAGEKNLWLFWKGQSLLLTGKLDEAEVLIPMIENKGQAERLDQSLHLARSQATGDMQHIVKFLENKVRVSNDPLDLFELCECYFEAQNWSGIASRAKALVEQVGTAASLHLAAEASFRAGETRLCLELLEGREQLFPSGQLPLGLRRIKVHCWRKEGQLHLALEEAEKLVRETQASADLMTFVGVKIESADLKGAATESRRLLERSDVPAMEHLNLARALQLEDPVIAGAHLDKALASGNRSPEFAVEALDLIFRLNREKMFPELQAALMQSAQAGGKVELTSPTQLIEMLAAQSERAKLAEKLYREGRVPLQFLSEVLGTTLSGVYQSYFSPTTDSGAWPPGAPIYVRHGGRGVIDPPQNIQRLYIDLSGLLIAAELDLMDVLEVKLGPCFFPANIIQAIYHQLQAAQQHQPSKLDEARVVSEALRAGTIHVIPDGDVETQPSDAQGPSPRWRELLKMAQDTGGFLVDYLPITTGFPQRPVALTSEENASIVSSNNVFYALNAAGKLTTGEVTDLRARALLRPSQDGQTIRSIPAGTSLYLHGNLPEVFAGSGLFPKLCSQFKVWIEASEKRTIDALLSFESRRVTLRSSLQSLLDKLQSGLGSKWQVLPAPNLDPAEKHSPESACILELTVADSVPGAFVWFDDRFLNGFAHCGSIPTTSTYDVLRFLHRAGALDDSTLFAKLYRLRAANFRYIPLEADEIAHHLRLARVVDDLVVESPELTILRRYISACLFERENLQMPPVAEGLPNPAGEIAFAMQVLEGVRQAIIKIWSEINRDNLSEITARADWIVQSVWCDVGVLPWLMRQENNAETNSVIGGALAPLYVQGVSLTGKARHRDPSIESPRTLYFQWLRERFASDEETFKSTAKALRDVFITGKFEQTRSEQEQKAFRILSAELIGDLPAPIRDSLDLPANVLSRLGIKLHRTLNVDIWSFDTREFWRAAGKAVRGKKVRIRSSDGAASFLLEYRLENTISPILRVIREGEQNGFEMSDPAFLLLSKNREARRDALISHPEWFDCAESRFYEQVAALAKIEDIPERMRQVEERRGRSAVWSYQELRSRRERGESVRLSNFAPPATEGLLNHLRLLEPPSQETLAAKLSEAALTLLSEIGFEEAFHRLATLPIALPRPVIDAYEKMSGEEQAEWSNKAFEHLQSPVGKLHVIGLLLRTLPERAINFLERLIEEAGEDDLDALVAILFWTQRQLDRREDTNGWPTATLLLMTWMHAGQIYEVLSPISPDEKIADYFVKASPLTSFDLFRVRDELTDDIAAPRRVRWDTLVLQALVAYTDEVSLDSNQIDRLQKIVHKLCFDSSGVKPLIRLELLTQPEWHRDSLGSFLRKDRAAFLARFLGSETAQLLSAEWITNLTRASITTVTEAPDKHTEEWNLLNTVLNTLPAPESLRESMQGLLLSEQIPDSDTLNSSALRVILYFLGQQSVNFDKAAPKMVEKLVAIAKTFSKTTTDSTNMRTNALALMECSNFIASCEASAPARARKFAQYVKMIIEAWPGASEPIWAVVSRFFSRVPASVGLALWPLVLELRRAADHSPDQILKAELESTDTEAKT